MKIYKVTTDKFVINFSFKYEDKIVNERVFITKDFYMNVKKYILKENKSSIDMKKYLTEHMISSLTKDELNSMFIYREKEYYGYSERESKLIFNVDNIFMREESISNSNRNIKSYKSKVRYVDVDKNKIREIVDRYYKNKFNFLKIRIYNKETIYLNIDENLMVLAKKDKNEAFLVKCMNPIRYSLKENKWFHEQPEYYKDYIFIGIVETKEDAISGKFVTRDVSYESYVNSISKIVNGLNE